MGLGIYMVTGTSVGVQSVGVPNTIVWVCAVGEFLTQLLK